MNNSTMKKLIIISLFTLMGCEIGSDGHEEEFSIGDGMGISWFRAYHIEGCEYIGRMNGNGAMLTHKGNCSNPIHHCPCDTIRPW